MAHERLRLLLYVDEVLDSPKIFVNWRIFALTVKFNDASMMSYKGGQSPYSYLYKAVCNLKKALHQQSW